MINFFVLDSILRKFLRTYFSTLLSFAHACACTSVGNDFGRGLRLRPELTGW